jgi:hypothetical protein
LKEGLGLDGDVKFYVGEAVAFGEQNRAAGVDADGKAGNSLTRDFRGDEGVDGLDVLRVERRKRGWCLREGEGRCSGTDGGKDGDDGAHETASGEGKERRRV